MNGTYTTATECDVSNAPATSQLYDVQLTGSAPAQSIGNSEAITAVIVVSSPPFSSSPSINVVVQNGNGNKSDRILYECFELGFPNSCRTHEGACIHGVILKRILYTEGGEIYIMHVSLLFFCQ